MKKHIVCFGDSNTFGLCADPGDCADGGTRFNEEERWPQVLQTLLGQEYLVVEEGLSGRTTVFDDPLYEGMSALEVACPILRSHEPIDLLIIMLGTNDTKERFGVNATCIAKGMDRLVKKCISIPCWGSHGPNILIICPPHISRKQVKPSMGIGCAQKSEELAAAYAPIAKDNGCAFLDAEGIVECNTLDYMHFTRKGHAALADRLAELVPQLL